MTKPTGQRLKKKKVSKLSYFVLRVCGPRLQHFFQMWPAVQKVCPPLG